jgi:ABC-type multidrug transport system permease subunit
VHALPLTWITDGLRAAMLGAQDGLGAWTAAAILAGFAAVTTGLAAKLFRWT